ncbi:MAG: hypothetical protein CMJ89_05585 [Planctomycetes bacterium]|nr:hypothetical protein [Planctomycetota bacterium]
MSQALAQFAAPRSLILGVLACGLALSGSCARGLEIVSPPGGGGGDPVDPPTGPTDFAPLAGLVSAAAGLQTVRVDWRLPRESKTKSFELALFMSTDRDTIFDGTPIAAPLRGTSLVLDGLTDGVRLHFGMGIREAASSGGMDDPALSGGTAFIPTGARLTVTPGPIVYVDGDAEATGADGTTPETAFPDPRLAILVAGFQLGGGNVWVRSGVYDNVGFIAHGAGIHVYGGFGADFDLATRDTSPGTTIFNAAPDNLNTPTLMIEMQSLAQIPIDEPVAILDGFTLEGNTQTFRAVQATNTAAEFRALNISGFLGSGAHLQNSDSQEYDIVVTGSSFSNNVGEGMDGRGAFDLVVDGCVFNSNGTEGLDLDDWIAPPGENVSLRITGSRFFGNGTEGLDVDLNVPLLVLDLTGGRFSVEIRGCSFERNGRDGVLLDMEYELYPQWNAKLVLRECLARANGTDGFHLDLDGPGSALLHRVIAAGNGTNGIEFSSESDPGTAFVSSSIAAGNMGAGILASRPPIGAANRSLVVTHSIVAGNFGPGIEGEAQVATASSTISHVQDVDGVMTEFRASLITAAAAEDIFVNAASAYARIDSDPGEGTLVLTQPADFDPGTTLEVADDGVARIATLVNPNNVTVDPPPALVLPPDLLSVFQGEDVVEDYRLASGSPAVGIGLSPPGGPSVDGGVFGSPVPGVPGFAEEIRTELFHPLSVAPAPSTPLGATDVIEIVFNETIHAASVNAASVRVSDGEGREVSVALDTSEDRLILVPPGGGWSKGVVWIELFAELESSSGTPNATPLALRFLHN